MSPQYDEPGGSRWQRTPFVIAHEVGHYYFGGSNQSWIDEGVAELLGAVSENARVGTAIGPDNDPCTLFQNIAELERVDPEKGTLEKDGAYRCHYSLGERLFLDLRDNLQEDTFRQGLRNLHLKSVREDPTDRCEGTDLGVCHLEAALKIGASAQIAATVDEVVARWYGEVPDATVEFDLDVDALDVSWLMGSALEKSVVMVVREGDAAEWRYVGRTADLYGGSAGFTNLGLAPGEYQIVVWSFSEDLADAGHTSFGTFTVPDVATLVDFASLENARYLEREMPQAAAAIKSLSWVADGITPSERDAVQELLYIAPFYAGVFDSLIGLRWLADRVDDAELSALRNVRSIAFRDLPAAESIIDMPFIETFEPPDGAAMRSLELLAYFDPQAFREVLSHPTLSGGINNYWAQIVAVLYEVSRFNPPLIDVLLDPARVTVEERSTRLPLSGDVALAVIRTEPGAPRSMDLLEHSARSAEAFMGEPLPNRYVGLLFEEAVPPGSAGTNSSTHITVRPPFDVDDGSHQAGSVAHIIAHEVAHYYWSGNQTWVDEGAADFLATISEHARTSRPVDATNFPCGYVSTIAELESLDAGLGSGAFECNYALGERFFLDLYRNLGAEDFRRGFLSLYLMSLVEDDADQYPGTSVGIEHVRDAFRTGGTAASSVIARWYDGTEPHDATPPDTRPVDARLPGINGRIDEAYTAAEWEGPAVSVFSGESADDWVKLILKYSYRFSGTPREVVLEIAEYFEDGFQIRRRSVTITAESRYAEGTHLSVVGPPPRIRWAPWPLLGVRLSRPAESGRGVIHRRGRTGRRSRDAADRAGRRNRRES